MDASQTGDREYEAGRPQTSKGMTGLLTVVSANLLNPYFQLRPYSRKTHIARLDAFARLVESERGDILLLQEVGRSREFRVDNYLGEKLGMAVVYARANGHAERWNREEGLAILSHYPLTQMVTIELGGGLWRRPALGAVATTPRGAIAVYSVHLSLRPWRNRGQVEALAAWVTSTAGELPAVIGGDFNTPEASPQIATLRERWIDAFRTIHPSTDGTTHELKLMGQAVRRERLDYLFVRQGASEIRIANCEHKTSPDKKFSDHLAVVGRFSSTGSPT